MATDWNERLAAMMRELEQQDEAWGRVKETLSRAGSTPLSIQGDQLEAIDLAASQPASPAVGVRA
jgi:hypothetical protein